MRGPWRRWGRRGRLASGDRRTATARPLYTLSSVLIAIVVEGIIAFAVSGLIEAMRRRMDVVGVVSVATGMRLLAVARDWRLRQR